MIIIIIIAACQKEMDSKSSAVKPLTANVIRQPPQPPAKQHKDKDRTQQPAAVLQYKDKDKKTALQPITSQASKAQHSKFCDHLSCYDLLTDVLGVPMCHALFWWLKKISMLNGEVWACLPGSIGVRHNWGHVGSVSVAGITSVGVTLAALVLLGSPRLGSRWQCNCMQRFIANTLNVSQSYVCKFMTRWKYRQSVENLR